MEKLIIDERTGWEYELQGDYYYPTGRVMRDGVLTPETVDNDPEEEQFIGVWGQRHLRFIRLHRISLYLDLYMSGKLNAYLADINAQAEDFFFRTVNIIAAQEGLTEALKAEDQIAWIQRKNNICNRATEIVNRELIFT
ncbi:MAG: TnpV protein [Clostridia bacterium]|nr:TnpV protein [Clostridia bacterium]